MSESSHTIPPLPSLDTLLADLERAAKGAGVPAGLLAEAKKGADWFAILEWLVPKRGELATAAVADLRAACESLLRSKAFAHPAASGTEVTPVVFGTGGHRGEIGKGLTLAHVHAIVQALIGIIAGLSEAERKEHFDTAALDEIKRRGFVLGHDNRLLNPEFTLYAASLLREAGYGVRYAGRISTPELSLLVPRREWAGSLNFTPSHNPFRYGGIKFAPADGGLAGPELTDPLAAEANRLLEGMAPAQWPDQDTLIAKLQTESERIERVRLHEEYLDALAEHPVIALDELRETILALPEGQRPLLAADPVWAAAIPVYEALRNRLGHDVVTVLHTDEDPYFGGQVTEPNTRTLGDALDVLRASRAPHKVAIRNDPDGDRGLVGDEGGALKMNRFAPLVMRYLLELGHKGDLVTTHATSHMGPDFARSRGAGVHLTPTGFKNFRPFIRDDSALIAYEESDGMTIRGHTMDKDGILAGLIALRMVLHYGRPLSELAAELEEETGTYHYLQETFMIDMPAKEAKRRLGKLANLKPGAMLPTPDGDRPITEVNAEDGYKFVLDRGAWVMMRPSGTEPKVRVYAESREGDAATLKLCEAAKAMALQAVQEP